MPGPAKIPYRYTALKATKQEVTDVKGAVLSYYHVYNQDSSVSYLQFYDADSDNVTVGTTTPDFTLAVPASGWLELSTTDGIYEFKTALTIAATTTVGGSTNPTNGLLVNLGWR